MNSSKKNFTLIHASGDARTELHDELGLTGGEVSVNDLPAGAAVPFVHAHQQNEELYGILSGAGEIWLDGEVIARQLSAPFGHCRPRLCALSVFKRSAAVSRALR